VLAIVLVSRLHKPALRALALARSIRPDVMTALTLSVDYEATHQLRTEWEQRAIPVPLTVLDGPYRGLSRPLTNYVSEVRAANPHTVVMVFIPEYVVTRWWQQLLHNQRALRFKARLLFAPGIVVVDVPTTSASGTRAGSAPPSLSPRQQDPEAVETKRTDPRTAALTAHTERAAQGDRDAVDELIEPGT
jgi:hypothetical protein